MSDQPSLFEYAARNVFVDVMPRRSGLPPVYTLPEVLVLRDWMLAEGLEGLHEGDGKPISPCRLIDLAPERAATLADLAWTAMIAHLREEWRPERIKFGGSGTKRRLTAEELRGGVAIHIEALQFARTWRLATHRVQTRLVGRGRTGITADVARFTGSILKATRQANENSLLPESRIPLIPGWQAQQRKGTQFPWDPPPKGWTIDRRAGRLVRETREGWLPRAAFEAANQPVVIDVRGITAGGGS